MMYFVKWWDSEDPYDKRGRFVTKGFNTRKDCLKFIMKYMSLMRLLRSTVIPNAQGYMVK